MVIQNKNKFRIKINDDYGNHKLMMMMMIIVMMTMMLIIMIVTV